MVPVHNMLIIIPYLSLMLYTLTTDSLHSRDILDTESRKNGKWKHIDPFAEPFIKPKEGFGYTELHLLFYTKYVS